MTGETDPTAERHAAPTGASLDAAIVWAAAEVSELTPLRFIGAGYFPPDQKGPYPSGTIGWSFMSWILCAWLDAGLIEVHADSHTDPDEDLRRRGWLHRAATGRQWLILQPEDARALLSDVSLWGLGHEGTGMMIPVWTALGQLATPDEWIRAALTSRNAPPALEEHPGQRSVTEWGNAQTDWEALSVKWEFPAAGGPDKGSGRPVARPRLFVVRRRTADGEIWARSLAESEAQIRSLHGDADVWLEVEALRDHDIAVQVEALRKTVPVPIDQGLRLLRLSSDEDRGRLSTGGDLVL